MKKILLLLALIPFFTIQNIKANHYSGTDLSLTCLGGNTYLVTLTYYHDCEGVPASSSIPIHFTCSSDTAFNGSTNKLGGEVFSLSKNSS